MDRTTMSPGSGKMLKSDNTELDVATLLEALEDAVDAIQTASEAVQAAVEGTLTAELSGSLASVSDTITRPDDTAPYTGGGCGFHSRRRGIGVCFGRCDWRHLRNPRGAVED